MIKRLLNILRRLLGRRRSALSDNDFHSVFLLRKTDSPEMQLTLHWIGRTPSDMEILRNIPNFTLVRIESAEGVEVGEDGSNAGASSGIIYIGGTAKDPMARILKSASMEMPVIFGAEIAESDEAYEILSIGGALTADNSATLGRIADRLLHDPEEHRRRAAWIAEWLDYHNRQRVSNV